MHLGWMALFGHSTCLKASFGRVCPAHLPCCRQGFKPSWKTPSKAAVSAPSRAEQPGCAWEKGGWKAGREMPCLHILLRPLLEEETAFGLIYISAAPVTAAYAESWLVVRGSSTALVFPAAPSTPAQDGQGAVSALQGQSCLETPCCTSWGSGKGCKASTRPFYSCQIAGNWIDAI